MGLRMKNFNIIPEKSDFKGWFMKNLCIGGNRLKRWLGRFEDLREMGGRLGKKEEVVFLTGG